MEGCKKGRKGGKKLTGTITTGKPSWRGRRITGDRKKHVNLEVDLWDMRGEGVAHA
jgi:hypothetical protein